jgi:hypothetical protein
LGYVQESIGSLGIRRCSENLPASIFLRMVELGILNQYDHGRNIETGKGFISTDLRVETPNCEIHSESYGPTFMRGNDGEYPEPILTEADDGSYSPKFETSHPLNKVIPISVSGSSTAGSGSQVSSQFSSSGSPEGFESIPSLQSPIRS